MRFTYLKHFLLGLGILSSSLLSAQDIISQDKPVKLSSVHLAHEAKYAVDGDKEEVKTNEKYARTKGGQYQYMQIDLEHSYTITKVNVFVPVKSLSIDFLRGCNNDLIIVASNDPNFKDLYNPNSISQKPMDYTWLSVRQAENVINISKKLEGRYLRIWTRAVGSSGLCFREVEVYGTISQSAVADAIKTGNASDVKTAMDLAKSAGVKVDHSEVLRASIGKKSNDLISSVLLADNHVTAADFEFAFADSNFNSRSITTLLDEGEVKLSSKVIDLALDKGDDVILNKMLAEDKTKFTLAHAEMAMSNKKMELTKDILSKNSLTPNAAMMKKAVQTGDFSLVNEFLTKYGGQASPDMLNEALLLENTNLTNLLLSQTQPNSTSYTIAAQKNNTDVYMELIEKKPISNNASVNIAIDKGNEKIVKKGLSNGGNADEALKYAMSKKNKSMITYIVGHKDTDPNVAIDYAVTNNNTALFDQILANPKSDKSKAFTSAATNVKDNLAIKALATGEVDKKKLDDFLTVAVQTDRDEFAKSLIANGADPNKGMQEAVRMNKIELVKLMIEKGATATDARYINNAAKLNLALTTVLVEAGADANNGIFAASEIGKTDIVKYLLEKGADANKGISAAIKGNFTETAVALIDKGADCKPAAYINIAALNGNKILVTKLLENAATAQNGVNSAIRNNRGAVLSILIDNEANVKDDKYLETAIRSNANTIVPIIIAQGVDAKRVLADGSNYLHLSSSIANSLQVVSILIKAGVDVNLKNNEGNTPLHNAAAEGKDNLSVIEALVAAGSEVNAVNNKGDTVRKHANGAKAKNKVKSLGGLKKIK